MCGKMSVLQSECVFVCARVDTHLPTAVNCRLTISYFISLKIQVEKTSCRTCFVCVKYCYIGKIFNYIWDGKTCMPKMLCICQMRNRCTKVVSYDRLNDGQGLLQSVGLNSRTVVIYWIFHLLEMYEDIFNILHCKKDSYPTLFYKD